MKRVVVGIIGSGFAAGLHLNGYRKVNGINVVLKSLASNGPAEQARQFAEAAGITHIYEDYHELLKDEEIDVIDICTPPFLHENMVIEALKANKHVICEKPLTGYFEEQNQKDNVGFTVSKAKMYESVMHSLERIRAAAESGGALFMYAENWIYAPVVQKSAELLRAKKDKILFVQAEESHNGSHAFHAANWKYTGGGALIRQGCHPISAILYLKQVEAQARGETIEIASVLADVGVCTASLTEQERIYIDADPVDVEDIANVIITFSDGTKAHILSSDIVLGGMRNSINVYTNDAVHRCNMSPSDNMMVYHAQETNLEHVYFAEKLGTKQGWQYIGIQEEIARGYLGELQDFMECVAVGRKPMADFKLAYDTARVIYAAYQSGEESRKIYLS